MLTSVVSGIRNVRQYRELDGARVLVTGISPATGVDIARAFAEAGARLVLQLEPAGSDDAQATNAALLQVLANTATEIRATEQPLADGALAVRFAQGAAQAYGGLDAVINVIVPPRPAFGNDADVEEVEAAVSDTLRCACLITRVIANRMSLTWSEGLVLNAILAPRPQNAAEEIFHGLLAQAIATMTRSEARDWADKGIRINAVAPHTKAAGGGEASGLAGESDVAALALHLASERGKALSGHVFDAAGVATRRC